ncbi:acylphosphatase [Evansella clarkii]|uniref:acylphosphatase n=1 Tax=Evansella clarkii TaxID=79879 RepID=UPI001116BB6A|nr:acylphosphatase [Evansella clarkii]
MKNISVWLPHLNREVVKGVRGFKLCAYLIALEGWRRGLTLTWYSNSNNVNNIKKLGNSYNGKFFSLSSKDRTHYFFRSRGDLVTNEAVDITRNKEETKKWLKKSNVPFPEGKRFEAPVSDEEIIEYGTSLGFPLVVKPTSGSLGQGVMTNLNDEAALREAVLYVRSELNFKDIIVEQFICGEDYRVYVIGDKVVGAVKRKSANVVGDGKNTIRELIAKKNRRRKKNPYLYTRLINVDKEVDSMIQKLNYTMESIPKKDEIIFLKGKSNLSSGGDSVDATDELTEEMKQVAINSLKAVPGLPHAGVDIISDKTNTVLIEINPTAIVGSHIYPMEGKARDIPSAIIDYYFPETINDQNQKSRMYFNFKSIQEPLASGITSEIKIAPPAKGDLSAKKYTIIGEVQGVGFRQYIRRKAFEFSLSGWVKNTEDGSIEVVVCGKESLDLDRFKLICVEGTERTNVKEVREEPWPEMVMSSFEILDDSEKNQKKKNHKEIEEYKKEIENLKTQLNERNDIIVANKQQLEEISNLNLEIKQEKVKAEKELNKIKNSRIWRYTQPVRDILTSKNKN